jgi:hypothetical protein
MLVLTRLRDWSNTLQALSLFICVSLVAILERAEDLVECLLLLVCALTRVLVLALTIVLFVWTINFVFERHLFIATNHHIIHVKPLELLVAVIIGVQVLAKHMLVTETTSWRLHDRVLVSVSTIASVYVQEVSHCVSVVGCAATAEESVSHLR